MKNFNRTKREWICLKQEKRLYFEVKKSTSSYNFMHPPDFWLHLVSLGQQCRPSSQHTPYKEIVNDRPTRTNENLTFGWAQQAYWLLCDLQQVWFDGQTISDEPHWVKSSCFSAEIVEFNWHVSCCSSQMYLNGQHIEPFEPQQTPFNWLLFFVIQLRWRMNLLEHMDNRNKWFHRDLYLDNR